MKNLLMLIDSLWYASYIKEREATELSAEAFAEFSNKTNNILTLDDTGADIEINGPLSQDGPDALDLFLGYGGVSYLAVQEAITEAHETLQANLPININVSTPGGDLSGVEATYLLIKEVAKHREVNAYVHGLCASAGMWITAGCTSITAVGSTSLMGSVGVATQVADWSEAEKEMGVVVYDLTNPQSEDKRPDMSTESGRNVISSELSELYEVFISNLVEGRDGRLTREGVEELKGACVASDRALAVGFADSVELPTFGIGPKDGLTGVKDMLLSELLAEHPEAKAELDKMIADSKALGHSEEAKAVKARAEEVSMFMDSEAYPNQVKKSCVKAITGERSIDAVKDLVSMVDAQIEKEAKAKPEPEAQKQTPPQDPTQLEAEAKQREVDARAEMLKGVL